MRKSSWVILTVLFVAIGAPNALADTEYIYTYTYSPVAGNSFSFTTQPQDLTAALDTPATPASLASETTTGIYSEVELLDYTLDFDIEGGLVVDFDFPLLDREDFFSPFAYVVPGTYTGDLGGVTDTLVVSTVQTPEPSTASLILLGSAFLLLMRKRIADGLQQAS